MFNYNSNYNIHTPQSSTARDEGISHEQYDRQRPPTSVVRAIGYLEGNGVAQLDYGARPSMPRNPPRNVTRKPRAPRKPNYGNMFVIGGGRAGGTNEQRFLVIQFR